MKKAIVTGGRGFLGRHICKALVAQGYHVHSFDDMSTINGSLGLELSQINQSYSGPDGQPDRHGAGVLEEHDVDVTEVNHDNLWHEVMQVAKPGIDEIWHFASPASPQEYKEDQLNTLRLGGVSLDELLRIAKLLSTSYRPVTVVFASSSEVYGDPTPEAFGPRGIPESYRGNVSTTGPRSMYDEAKRYGEALCAAWAKQGVRVLIPRIHNTYGPGMSAYDGRVVSTLLRCAITGLPFVAHDMGMQYRTFCYVSDLVEQLMLLRDKGPSGEPVNVGGTDHLSIGNLAEIVQTEIATEPFQVSFDGMRQDEHDPRDRCPDLSKIRALGWPGTRVSLRVGLHRTRLWMETELDPDRRIGHVAQD